MGLSPYPTPSDAGVLCVILVNTAMSISIMKEIVRSILHVVGIHVASWEDYSNQALTESVECRGSPSETYMEEFRSRTPSLLYDSLCRRTKQECSVCLIEFKPDAEINRLSCGHVFHKSCLEKWLKYWNITCPLCRNHMMMPREVEENTCPMVAMAAAVMLQGNCFQVPERLVKQNINPLATRGKNARLATFC